ncbi:hypothetical protein EFR01_44640 [Sinorhizobium fredii]|nr:hypothetical protein EFR01_44640 [Sinorhizobium fredii]GLS12475.1 hypothetical protein GCM10007864_61080 [Sinorhizobium fredii]
MYHPALFKGMNVVVTGAGRGIGLEVARQFLDCGARVLVHVGRTTPGTRPDFLDLVAAEGRAFLSAADFLAAGGVETLATASTCWSTMPAPWSVAFRRRN